MSTIRVHRKTLDSAEYMAKSAERLMKAMRNFDLATSKDDNGDAVDAAIVSVAKARRELKFMINEFRNRAQKTSVRAEESLGPKEREELMRIANDLNNLRADIDSILWPNSGMAAGE